MAYRRHMNQQDAGHFNDADFNTSVQNLSGVFVPGRGVVMRAGDDCSRNSRRRAKGALRSPTTRTGSSSSSGLVTGIGAAATGAKSAADGQCIVVKCVNHCFRVLREPAVIPALPVQACQWT